MIGPLHIRTLYQTLMLEFKHDTYNERTNVVEVQRKLVLMAR